MRVLLSYAFRPFFLLATLYAIFIIPYWTAAWLGRVPSPMWLGTPSWWHAHEMIYGFAGAAIGGFALTAVATWTGRPPVARAPLLVLTVLWILARFSFFVPASALHTAAMVSDLAYGLLLLALMSREVIGSRNRRNYKVLLLLALLPITNAFFFAGVLRRSNWTGAALVAALWSVLLLVNLIAGRIVPAFTRNWLRSSGRTAAGEASVPPPWSRLDGLAAYLMIAFAALHVWGGAPRWAAACGALTSALFAVRLFRWQGWRTVDEPLVWILHLGFAWLPVGFLLLALAEIGLVPRTSGIHALTSGAITTMVIAVAGRAALGHTGRPLHSHPVLTASYVLITLAAVCRVIAAFEPDAQEWLVASASAWCLGFGGFAWRYVPILVGGARGMTTVKTVRPGSD